MEFQNFGFTIIKRCSIFRVLDRALQYVIKTGIIEVFHQCFLSSLHRPFTDEEFLDVYFCHITMVSSFWYVWAIL